MSDLDIDSKTCDEILKSKTSCTNAKIKKLQECAGKKGISQEGTHAQLVDRLTRAGFCKPTKKSGASNNDNEIAKEIRSKDPDHINTWKYFNQFTVDQLRVIYKTFVKKSGEKLEQKGIEILPIKKDMAKEKILKIIVDIIKRSGISFNVDSYGRDEGVKNFIPLAMMKTMKVDLGDDDDEMDMKIEAEGDDRRSPPRARTPPAPAPARARVSPPRMSTAITPPANVDDEMKCGRYSRKLMTSEFKKAIDKGTFAKKFKDVILKNREEATAQGRTEQAAFLSTLKELPSTITTAEDATNYICEIMNAEDCDVDNECANPKKACNIDSKKCVRHFGGGVVIGGKRFIGSENALAQVRRQLEPPKAEEVISSEEEEEGISSAEEDEPVPPPSRRPASPQRQDCNFDNDYECPDDQACDLKQKKCVPSAGKEFEMAGRRKLIGDPAAVAAVKGLLAKAGRYCDVDYDCGNISGGLACDLETNRCVSDDGEAKAEYTQPKTGYKFIGSIEAVAKAKAQLKAKQARPASPPRPSPRGGARGEAERTPPPPRVPLPVPPALPSRPPPPVPKRASSPLRDVDLAKEQLENQRRRARELGISEGAIKGAGDDQGKLRQLIEGKQIDADDDRQARMNVDAVLAQLTSGGRLSDETRQKVTSKILQCLGVA